MACAKVRPSKFNELMRRAESLLSRERVIGFSTFFTCGICWIRLLIRWLDLLGSDVKREHELQHGHEIYERCNADRKPLHQCQEDPGSFHHMDVRRPPLVPNEHQVETTVKQDWLTIQAIVSQDIKLVRNDTLIWTAMEYRTEQTSETTRRRDQKRIQQAHKLECSCTMSEGE